MPGNIGLADLDAFQGAGLGITGIGGEVSAEVVTADEQRGQLLMEF